MLVSLLDQEFLVMHDLLNLVLDLFLRAQKLLFLFRHQRDLILLNLLVDVRDLVDRVEFVSEVVIDYLFRGLEMLFVSLVVDCPKWIRIFLDQLLFYFNQFIF